ncbi:MAG: hypothetical protein F4X45_01980 [Chloroflexi bacterium]|nr:hypothetical protein [Chloroflexota bacterium]
MAVVDFPLEIARLESIFAAGLNSSIPHLRGSRDSQLATTDFDSAPAGIAEIRSGSRSFVSSKFG